MTKTNTAATPAPAVAAAPADPFANVPVVNLADDVSFRDFTDVKGSQPYKYAKVDAEARADHLPMLKNYKHGSAILIPGTNRAERRPGTVYGDIVKIVNAHGRAGVATVVLITELRQMQVGNKRSKYCDSIPPIGWAEGWLNTAITKNIVGVHATRSAPPLTAMAEAKAKADSTQPKLAANG